MPHVVIIGAGISGLSIAYRLRQANPALQITILEKAARIGGNIRTDVRDGFRVECGPNGFLDSKPSTIQLCRDLGLAQNLLAASEDSRRHRYLFWKGKLRALPGSIGSFLTSDLLSFRGKINLLLERYRRRPRYLNGDESIAQFARRRAGREVADVFADAMVTGIHGGDAKLLSLAAAFPRVALFEKQFGSVMRGFTLSARQRKQDAIARGESPQPARMWSFREGLQVVVERLEEMSGTRVIKSVCIRSIESDRQPDAPRPQWIVRGEGADRWPADAVILACPAHEQAHLIADLDADLAGQMAAIAYNAIAVVALGFRQEDCPNSFAGFGYIAPQATRRDVLGVQWCSSIFPDRAPAGMVLWRALCGGWNRPDVLSWTDDELSAAVYREIRLAMHVRGQPVFRHIVRWPQAIPQYLIGHNARVQQIETRADLYSGLFVAGNAYHGVALNDCTEQAELIAQRVQHYLLG